MGQWWTPEWRDELRRVVLDAPPDAAVAVVARRVSESVGAAVEIRLSDRAGWDLHPVAASGAEPDQLETWSLDRGAAADALWTRTVVREPGSGALHVPITARGTAYGVLTVCGPGSAGLGDRVDDDRPWAALGQVVALVVGQAGQATDAWEVRRRASSYTVSAEMQWQQLPPTSLVADGVELHALIEPAPRVSSDLFDWSIDRGRLWLAVLDADGRGLSASLSASVALAALRHARRSGLPLGEQISLVDQAVYDQFRGRAVVRAVVVEIEPGVGARMVAAGDPVAVPRVLRRRRGEVVELAATENEDLGLFDRSQYVEQAVELEDGDDLLVVTDGGPQAGQDEQFGMAAVVQHFATMRAPAALPRRLLDDLRRHVGGDLVQDATALVVSLRR